MWPPMLSPLSTRYTLKPMPARSNAALIPAIPPPKTMALFVTGTSRISRSWSSLAFATAILMISFAFSVASLGVLG